MTNYIYSTATCSAFYCTYHKTNEKDLGRIAKKVEIKGGHGVATQKTCITPRGVVTAVNDEDMEFLLQNLSFQKHVKAGFLSYDKKEVAPEKKVKDMAQKDGSAPITPQDFVESDSSTSDIKVYKKKGAPE